MILEQYPELRRLSRAEKLNLVSELWDDLALHPEEVPVSPAQMAELDRRMEIYYRDQTQVTTWEVIQKQISAGKDAV